MSKPIDVIDLYEQLQKKFPYVEFIIVETEKSVGFSKYKFHEFRLKRYHNQIFETPIKTSISIRQDANLDTDDYFAIEKMMYESFTTKKQFGII